MRGGSDTVIDGIQDTGNIIGKVGNLIGALSGDPTKLVDIATDEFGNRAEDQVKARDGLGLAICTARAVAGDPFAQIEFGYRMIKFLANEGFKDSITIPPTAHLNPKLKKSRQPQKAKTFTSATSAPKPVVAKVKYDSIGSVDVIDTSDSHIEQVDITFTMEDLIDLDNFGLNFAGNSYEEIKLIHDLYQGHLNGPMIQQKHDAVTACQQADYDAIQAKMNPIIQQAKNWQYDPDGLLAQLQQSLDEAYSQRRQYLQQYHDEIDNAKEARQDAYDMVVASKANIADYKEQIANSSGAERRELYEMKNSAYEVLNEHYADLNLAKERVSEAYDALNTEADTEDIDATIEEIKTERRTLKQRYVDELYARKTELIEELNQLTQQKREQVNKLRSFVINNIQDMRNTSVKKKECNWATCIGEFQGKSRVFDLSFGSLEFFISKGFEEQASCQVCIDYKKMVESKAKNNELRIPCQGATILGPGGQEELKPCATNKHKDLTQQHVIGMPKKKGDVPYMFDGTDKYQCKACQKAQTDSESQVPFIDLPKRAQELIDGYLDTQGVPEYSIKDGKNKERIQSRFYYSVMYDILSSSVVQTGLNLSASISAVATAANYNANYYEVTPQQGSSLESAALHLLKHMLDLGEKFNHGSWSPGIEPGNHDQVILRTILGQPVFNHTNKTGTVPRQLNGVVDIVNYPSSLDTITPQARSFLQIGLDKIRQINTGLEGMHIVNAAGPKHVIKNPFVEVVTVYKNGKVCSTYYMNNQTQSTHIQQFQSVVTNNLSTYYQAAKIYYGIGGNGYKLDAKQKNKRLEFLDNHCPDLLANPHKGWKSGKMNQLAWNL
jgi:hypothetical protein